MAQLGATEFSELVVTTLRKIAPQLYDNVTLKHPLLELLRDEQESDTGRALVVPLELGLDDNTQLTDDSGSFSTTVSGDIVGAAEYAWSDPIVSSVRLRWKLLEENQGPQQQINLLKTHIKNCEYSHGRKLVEWLHARASVAAIPTNRFHSLDQLVSDAAYDADPAGDASIAAFTVGGIDAATQPLWEGHRVELPLDGAFSIRKAFRHVENEVSVATSNKNRINAFVCGRDVFEEFVDSFDDAVRYTEFGEGQSHFREVKHGDLVIRLDPDCPAKRAYALDTDSLVFRSLAGNFMKPQDPQRIPGTLDWVHPLASVLSIGVNERRANAVLLRPSTAGGDA